MLAQIVLLLALLGGLSQVYESLIAAPVSSGVGSAWGARGVHL